MLVFLVGCMDMEPKFVDARDLDKALGSGDTAALCAGLRMKDEGTRRAAAEKLKDYGLDSSCLCERLEYDGRWDPAILSGLKGSKDVAKVGCVGDLLGDPTQPDRASLATVLVGIPATRPRVVKAANEDTDPAVRAAAFAVYCGTKDPAELAILTTALASHSDAGVRVAAATALHGQASADTVLTTASNDDADPAVRGAALATMVSYHPAELTPRLCDAMMKDPAAEVRIQAVTALRATRDPAQLACLRARLTTEEAEPTVRAAVLAAVKASSSPLAADLLCEAIPGWVTMYVKDAAPEESDSILRAQNDRDQARSYDCVQAALRRGGGYSCHGREYVASFFRELGGKAPVPACDGKRSRGGAASNEVSFE